MEEFVCSVQSGLMSRADYFLTVVPIGVQSRAKVVWRIACREFGINVILGRSCGIELECIVTILINITDTIQTVSDTR